MATKEQIERAKREKIWWWITEFILGGLYLFFKIRWDRYESTVLLVWIYWIIVIVAIVRGFNREDRVECPECHSKMTTGKPWYPCQCKCCGHKWVGKYKSKGKK